MINKIKNWSYDKPTEEGLYLICRGDVETEYTVSFERLDFFEGSLRDDSGVKVSSYHNDFKYAKLEF